MRKLLVSIDGASQARTQSAVAQAVAIYNQERVEVHLLNVQPALSSHVAMFFDAGELHAILETTGQEELASAASLLDMAGVPHTTEVLTGRSAQTIARRARELGCDRIVIGRDDGEGIASRMFGNLVSQVRHIVGGTGDCQVLGS
jgi:nucleotide-binding universal stress UspA family protein